MYNKVSSAKNFLLFLALSFDVLCEHVWLLQLRRIVMIVKYYQYNGFLFTSQININWNNNIGPALLICWTKMHVSELKNCGLLSLSLSTRLHSQTYNIDVLPAIG